MCVFLSPNVLVNVMVFVCDFCLKRLLIIYIHASAASVYTCVASEPFFKFPFAGNMN